MDTVTVKRTIDMPPVVKALKDGYLTLRYEQGCFNVATHITAGEYTGGTWELKELSNGGFFLAYTGDETFKCHNHAAYWEGELSGDAFSIAVNVYVSSNLAFWLVDHNQEEAAQRVSDNYHLLRDYFLQDDNNPFSQDEIRAILGAID